MAYDFNNENSFLSILGRIADGTEQVSGGTAGVDYSEAAKDFLEVLAQNRKQAFKVSNNTIKIEVAQKNENKQLIEELNKLTVVTNALQNDLKGYRARGEKQDTREIDQVIGNYRADIRKVANSGFDRSITNLNRLEYNMLLGKIGSQIGARIDGLEEFTKRFNELDENLRKSIDEKLDKLSNEVIVKNNITATNKGFEKLKNKYDAVFKDYIGQIENVERATQEIYRDYDEAFQKIDDASRKRYSGRYLEDRIKTFSRNYGAKVKFEDINTSAANSSEITQRQFIDMAKQRGLEVKTIRENDANNPRLIVMAYPKDQAPTIENGGMTANGRYRYENYLHIASSLDPTGKFTDKYGRNSANDIIIDRMQGGRMVVRGREEELNSKYLAIMANNASKTYEKLMSAFNAARRGTYEDVPLGLSKDAAEEYRKSRDFGNTANEDANILMRADVNPALKKMYMSLSHRIAMPGGITSTRRESNFRMDAMRILTSLLEVGTAPTDVDDLRYITSSDIAMQELSDLADAIKASGGSAIGAGGTRSLTTGIIQLIANPYSLGSYLKGSYGRHTSQINRRENLSDSAKEARRTGRGAGDKMGTFFRGAEADSEKIYKAESEYLYNILNITQEEFDKNVDEYIESLTKDGKKLTPKQKKDIDTLKTIALHESQQLYNEAIAPQFYGSRTRSRSNVSLGEIGNLEKEAAISGITGDAAINEFIARKIFGDNVNIVGGSVKIQKNDHTGMGKISFEELLDETETKLLSGSGYRGIGRAVSEGFFEFLRGKYKNKADIIRLADKTNSNDYGVMLESILNEGVSKNFKNGKIDNAVAQVILSSELGKFIEAVRNGDDITHFKIKNGVDMNQFDFVEMMKYLQSTDKNGNKIFGNIFDYVNYDPKTRGYFFTKENVGRAENQFDWTNPAMYGKKEFDAIMRSAGALAYAGVGVTSEELANYKRFLTENYSNSDDDEYIKRLKTEKNDMERSIAASTNKNFKGKTFTIGYGAGFDMNLADPMYKDIVTDLDFEGGNVSKESYEKSFLYAREQAIKKWAAENGIDLDKDEVYYEYDTGAFKFGNSGADRARQRVRFNNPELSGYEGTEVYNPSRVDQAYMRIMEKTREAENAFANMAIKEQESIIDIAENAYGMMYNEITDNHSSLNEGLRKKRVRASKFFEAEGTSARSVSDAMYQEVTQEMVNNGAYSDAQRDMLVTGIGLSVAGARDMISKLNTDELSALYKYTFGKDMSGNRKNAIDEIIEANKFENIGKNGIKNLIGQDVRYPSINGQDVKMANFYIVPDGENANRNFARIGFGLAPSNRTDFDSDHVALSLFNGNTVGLLETAQKQAEYFKNTSRLMGLALASDVYGSGEKVIGMEKVWDKLKGANNANIGGFNALMQQVNFQKTGEISNISTAVRNMLTGFGYSEQSGGDKAVVGILTRALFEKLEQDAISAKHVRDKIEAQYGSIDNMTDEQKGEILNSYVSQLKVGVDAANNRKMNTKEFLRYFYGSSEEGGQGIVSGKFTDKIFLQALGQISQIEGGNEALAKILGMDASALPVLQGKRWMLNGQRITKDNVAELLSGKLTLDNIYSIIDQFENNTGKKLISNSSTDPGALFDPRFRARAYGESDAQRTAFLHTLDVNTQTYEEARAKAEEELAAETGKTTVFINELKQALVDLGLATKPLTDNITKKNSITSFIDEFDNPDFGAQERTTKVVAGIFGKEYFSNFFTQRMENLYEQYAKGEIGALSEADKNKYADNVDDFNKRAIGLLTKGVHYGKLQHGRAQLSLSDYKDVFLNEDGTLKLLSDEDLEKAGIDKEDSLREVYSETYAEQERFNNMAKFLGVDNKTMKDIRDRMDTQTKHNIEDIHTMMDEIRIMEDRSGFTNLNGIKISGASDIMGFRNNGNGTTSLVRADFKDENKLNASNVLQQAIYSHVDELMIQQMVDEVMGKSGSFTDLNYKDFSEKYKNMFPELTEKRFNALRDFLDANKNADVIGGMKGKHYDISKVLPLLDNFLELNSKNGTFAYRINRTNIINEALNAINQMPMTEDANGNKVIDYEAVKSILEKAGISEKDIMKAVDYAPSISHPANGGESGGGGKKKGLGAFLGSFLGTSIPTILRKLRTEMSKLVKEITQLDTLQTNIQIATGKSSEEVSKLTSNYSDLAEQLGVTTKEILSVSNAWLRQGYSVQETNKLIEETTKLSKLGMIDMSTATQAMTSTLKGFKMEASEAAQIVDKLTTLDMNYATSAGEIATALSRTASIANQNGMNLDETSAMATIIMDVTQAGATEVGNALRSMISRYGNIKVGKYVDSESGEGLNDVEKVLKTFGINVRSGGEMRDYSDVLADVASRWNSMSDVEKNAVSSAMAGTRQRNQFVALMENFDRYQDALLVAENSQGQADLKYEAYLDSIEGNLSKMRASWEGFIGDLKASGVVKLGTQGMTLLVKGLPYILTALSAILAMVAVDKGGSALKKWFGGDIGLGSLVKPMGTGMSIAGGIGAGLGAMMNTNSSTLSTIGALGSIKSKYLNSVNLSTGENVTRGVISGVAGAVGGAFLGPLGALIGSSLASELTVLVEKLLHQGEADRLQRVDIASSIVDNLTAIKNSLENVETTVRKERSMWDSDDYKALNEFADNMNKTIYFSDSDTGANSEEFRIALETALGIGLDEAISEIRNGGTKAQDYIRIYEEEYYKNLAENTYRATESERFDVQKELNSPEMRAVANYLGSDFASEEDRRAAIDAFMSEYGYKYDSIDSAIGVYRARVSELNNPTDQKYSDLLQAALAGSGLNYMSSTDINRYTVDSLVRLVAQSWGNNNPYVYGSQGELLEEARQEIIAALRQDDRFARVLRGADQNYGQMQTSYGRIQQMFAGVPYSDLYSAAMNRDTGRLQDIINRYGNGEAQAMAIDDLINLITKADPSKMEDLAHSFGMTVEYADKLGPAFKNLNAIMASTYDELKKHYAELGSMFERLAKGKTTFADINELLKDYEGYIKYTNGEFDRTGTLKAILEAFDNPSDMINSIVGKNIQEILSSDEIWMQFIENGNLTGDQKSMFGAYANFSEAQSAMYSPANEDVLNRWNTFAKGFLADLEIGEEVKEISLKLKEADTNREIENLNSIKESLADINTQREYEIKLIKARQALENAKNEKKRVYRAGKFMPEYTVMCI